MDSSVIKEHINKAFTYISTMLVKGDAVDYVAAARYELKEAFKLLEEKQDG